MAELFILYDSFDNYTITTLVENGVYGRKLQAEHGLSRYMETSGHRLLFDTGA